MNVAVPGALKCAWSASRSVQRSKKEESKRILAIDVHVVTDASRFTSRAPAVGDANGAKRVQGFRPGHHASADDQHAMCASEPESTFTRMFMSIAT